MAGGTPRAGIVGPADIRPHFGKRIELAARQVVDFMLARFEIEVAKPLDEGLPGGLSIAHFASCRSQKSIHAQIGKAAHAGVLGVAHAGGFDLLIEGAIPAGALPHLVRRRCEMGGKLPFECRATGREQRGGRARNDPHRV